MDTETTTDILTNNHICPAEARSHCLPNTLIHETTQAEHAGMNLRASLD